MGGISIAISTNYNIVLQRFQFLQLSHIPQTNMYKIRTEFMVILEFIRLQGLPTSTVSRRHTPRYRVLVCDWCRTFSATWTCAVQPDSTRLCTNCAQSFANIHQCYTHIGSHVRSIRGQSAIAIGRYDVRRKDGIGTWVL